VSEKHSVPAEDELLVCRQRSTGNATQIATAISAIWSATRAPTRAAVAHHDNQVQPPTRCNSMPGFILGHSGKSDDPELPCAGLSDGGLLQAATLTAQAHKAGCRSARRRPAKRRPARKSVQPHHSGRRILRFGARNRAPSVTDPAMAGTGACACAPQAPAKVSSPAREGGADVATDVVRGCSREGGTPAREVTRARARG